MQFNSSGPVPVISRYYSPPAPVRNCTIVGEDGGDGGDGGDGRDGGDGASLVHISVVMVLFFTALSYLVVY